MHNQYFFTVKSSQRDKNTESARFTSSHTCTIQNLPLFGTSLSRRNLHSLTRLPLIEWQFKPFASISISQSSSMSSVVSWSSLTLAKASPSGSRHWAHQIPPVVGRLFNALMPSVTFLLPSVMHLIWALKAWSSDHFLWITFEFTQISEGFYSFVCNLSVESILTQSFP